MEVPLSTIGIYFWYSGKFGYGRYRKDFSGRKMGFPGGKFDTLPFPLGVPNIKEQKRKFLLFPFVHPMRDFIF